MKKQNDKFIFNLCLILLTILVIVSFIVYSILVFTKEPDGFHVDEVNFLSISVISLVIAIAFGVPYFISERQIENKVKDYLANEYKDDLEISLEETARTDAHLSRMIAFLLMENGYYYWAIGWAYRALKRYSKIEKSYNKNYKDFHIFLIKDVILLSLKKIKQCLNNGKSLLEIEDSHAAYHTDYELVIRTIKDYIDFYYEINEKDKKEKWVTYLKDNCEDEFKEIDSAMENVIKKYVEENKNQKKELINEIITISSYKSVKEDKEKIEEKLKNLIG